MSVQSRLNAVERERSRLCVNCGGPMIVVPPRPKTWRMIVEDLQALPDEERIALAAHSNTMHKLSPRHQELAYHMYCDEQGIPYDSTRPLYSSPDPPPVPWFPEEGPVPKYIPKWPERRP